MDKEWLTKHYMSFGWTEQRITDFLRRAELNEKAKAREALRR